MYHTISAYIIAYGQCAKFLMGFTVFYILHVRLLPKSDCPLAKVSLTHDVHK